MRYLLRIYVTSIFLFIYYANFSQNNVILQGYSPEDTQLSYVQEMVYDKNGRIVFLKRTGSPYSAYVTDMSGNIIHQTVLELDGFTVNSSGYIFADDDRYVFIGNVIRDGIYYYASFAYDTALTASVLIDTVRLEGAELFFINVAKYNEHKNAWESFGNIKNDITNQITHNSFVRFDEEFHIERYQKIIGVDNPKPILEFIWLESMKRYVLSSFSRDFMLIDDFLNLQSSHWITHTFFFEGVTYTNSLNALSFFPAQDNNLLCYGEMFGQSPYSNFIATLKIENDTTILDVIIPLDSPSLEINLFSQMRVDQEGNYIISGMNRLVSGQPNKIRVVKFSPSFERLAEFTYADDKTFAIWDMEIASNNDIIIVGGADNMFKDGAHRGFLLKISADLLSGVADPPNPRLGQLSIVPNPTLGNFCVQHPNERLTYIRLYDAQGRLAFEQDAGFSDDLSCFGLPLEMSLGLYRAVFYFDSGERMIGSLVLGR
jgi:hypothetical protein